MGSLLGIAIAPKKRAPLIEMESATIEISLGLQGDARGTTKDRQVTILFREGWDQACSELGVQLPWVTRRANLLIQGVRSPEIGKRLKIGACILEVTQETKPCQVMESAYRGLRRALTPEWRGGVCCRVIAPGVIRTGDSVELL
jgi:MOSC domain-containing protein YiiM